MIRGLGLGTQGVSLTSQELETESKHMADDAIPLCNETLIKLWTRTLG